MTAQAVQHLGLNATVDHCSVAVHEIRALQHSNDGFGAHRPWFEALIRPHPGVGHNPQHFVDTLYAQRATVDTDLEIVERVGAWLRRQAEPTRININVHPKSLTHSRFVSAALRHLRQNSRLGHSICLELIEFGQAERKAVLVENAQRLRAAGMLIALDDFGSRVNCFDLCAAGIVDLLKIDTTVVCGMDRNNHQRAIVESIQTLARGLDAQVVAEGVETHGQLETLKALNVNFAQGFFFHRPTLLEI